MAELMKADLDHVGETPPYFLLIYINNFRFYLYQYLLQKVPPQERGTIVLGGTIHCECTGKTPTSPAF